MSKIAIFLCAVLFASAANASFWMDAVEKVQNKVEDVVNNAIEDVDEKFEAVNKKAQEIAQQLSEQAARLTERVRDQVKSVMNDVQAEIDKITGKAEGVDVTDCNRLAAHLDYTARSVMANMGKCVTDKIETGSAYIEDMYNISQEVIANLTVIREEAHHCADQVDGVKSAASAIVCVNMNAGKAAWVAAKVVPEIAVKMTKLNIMLGTLPPALTYCSATNGFVAFYKESSTIVEKTKLCVQQKIDEARGVVTEAVGAVEGAVSEAVEAAEAAVSEAAEAAEAAVSEAAEAVEASASEAAEEAEATEVPVAEEATESA